MIVHRPGLAVLRGFEEMSNVSDRMGSGTGKRRKFTAGKEARRSARTLIGQPPPERVIPDKRGKPPKHKKSMLERLEE